MKTFFTIGSSFLIFFFACTAKKNNIATNDCPPKACTMEFKSIGVIFQNQQGDTLQVKDYAVVLKSTGEKLPSAADRIPGSSYYLVSSDGDKNILSEKGDTLLIKATNPETGKTRSSEMVVSGGRCECHINKVSGEQTIVFND